MGDRYGDRYGQRLLALWEERARSYRAGEDPPETDDSDLQDEYRDLFRSLLEHAYDGVVINAVASHWIIEASASFCSLTGYAREELLGRTSVELGLIVPGPVREEAVTQATAGVEAMYETWLHCRGGERRWVQFSHQMLGPDFVLTVVRDQTAQVEDR